MFRAHSTTRLVMVLLLFALTLTGCGDDQGSIADGFPSRDDLYQPGVTTVAVEVDYEPNAEPYTTGIRLNETWSLFRSNVEALVEPEGIGVEVPAELSEMEALADIPDTDFTSRRLLELADEHWQDRGTAERRVFYVIFLDGYFMDDGERQESVVGVSIGDTGVIAMFKPVIDSTSVPRFVEQTTLIHEFGHAIGLVANGAELTANHHDEVHGAHCTNDQCVMYWLNEGAGDAAQFAQRFLTTGETVVFDQDCLNDVQATFRSQ